MTVLLYLPQKITLSRAEPIDYESFELQPSLLCSAGARLCAVLSRPILIVIDHTLSSSTLGKLRTHPKATLPARTGRGEQVICTMTSLSSNTFFFHSFF